ncbi:hypothetical protein [Geodermatophilus amargosae]|uniref:hypothetical protein n=1 Tax=Geodermatophilus amargosae TaxID=1296565 RepID=UPI0034DE76EC
MTRTPLRRTWPAALALAVAALAGCTAGEAESTRPSSSPVPLPPLAGASEAATVAGLPDGPASGTVVLTYSGLGELRSPLTGTCTSEGDRTVVAAEAGGASVVLTFDPAGAEVAVRDVGLETTSSVAAGDLAVEGAVLHLAADLVAAGQVVGTLVMDATCSG